MRIFWAFFLATKPDITVQIYDKLLCHIVVWVAIIYSLQIKFKNNFLDKLQSKENIRRLWRLLLDPTMRSGVKYFLNFHIYVKFYSNIIYVYDRPCLEESSWKFLFQHFLNIYRWLPMYFFRLQLWNNSCVLRPNWFLIWWCEIVFAHHCNKYEHP